MLLEFSRCIMTLWGDGIKDKKFSKEDRVKEWWISELLEREEGATMLWLIVFLIGKYLQVASKN